LYLATAKNEDQPLKLGLPSSSDYGDDYQTCATVEIAIPSTNVNAGDEVLPEFLND
jgi:hypothetical protein